MIRIDGFDRVLKNFLMASCLLCTIWGGIIYLIYLSNVLTVTIPFQEVAYERYEEVIDRY